MISIDYEFDRLPGSYRMIQGEGKFIVSQYKKKGVVRYICSTTNLIDVRPLIRMSKADVRIDFGWYSYVSTMSLATEYKL